MTGSFSGFTPDAMQAFIERSAAFLGATGANATK